VYCASKAALHVLTETLSMELAPFNVKATLVISGAVRSNISNNQHKAFILPPTSLFKDYVEYIVAAMFMSQTKWTIDADKFAKDLVKKLLFARPSSVIRGLGGAAWRVWFMTWLPRIWVFHFVANMYMGSPLFGYPST